MDIKKDNQQPAESGEVETWPDEHSGPSKFATAFAKHYNLDYMEALETTCYRYDEQIRIEDAEKIAEIYAQQSEAWVSCDERLPESGLKVLCLDRQGYMKIGAFYLEDKYFSGDDAYNNIDFWRELPTPPQ